MFERALSLRATGPPVRVSTVSDTTHTPGTSPSNLASDSAVAAPDNPDAKSRRFGTLRQLPIVPEGTGGRGSVSW